jgi:RHS repeat-associated protein
VAESYARSAAHFHKQYVWGLRYIDAPILRDRETDAGAAGLDERLYYTQDGNFNVTALVNPAGEVVERYSYDAYGQVTVRNGAENVDPDTVNDPATEWDADTDNASDVDNRILFAGYRFDSETGLYHVRHRYLHPSLGRWNTRDPLGYVDGMGLYEYVGSAPLDRCDPTGLMVILPPTNSSVVEAVIDWIWGDSDEQVPKPKQIVKTAWITKAQKRMNVKLGVQQRTMNLPGDNPSKGAVYARPRWARLYIPEDKSKAGWTTSAYYGRLTVEEEVGLNGALVQTHQRARLTVMENKWGRLKKRAETVNAIVDVGGLIFDEPVTSWTDIAFAAANNIIPADALHNVEADYFGDSITTVAHETGQLGTRRSRVVSWRYEGGERLALSKRKLPTGVCMSYREAHAWCRGFNAVMFKYMSMAYRKNVNLGSHDIPQKVWNAAFLAGLKAQRRVPQGN